MRKLLLVWAVWRMARVVGAIAVIAVLGMLVLKRGPTATPSHRGELAPIERAVQPIEQELRRTLERTLKP